MTARPGSRADSDWRFTRLPGFYNGGVVLVAGGLGFIGSNLVHRLANETDAEIRVLDSLNPSCGGHPENLRGISRPIQIHVADLNEADDLGEWFQGVDIVFNVAGQVSHLDSMDNPVQDLRANSEAQIRLLEACRRHNPHVRVVYTSTRQVYGRPRALPVDETHPIVPTDVNGINKYSGESFHRLYHQVHGIETCALRLTNTYGPRMVTHHARQGFLGWFVRKILDGDEVLLFGDGTQIRDLNYVECVLDALMLAGVHPAAPGKTYNLGSGEPITLLDLVRLMIEIAGKGSYRIEPFPEERRKIDIGSYYSDFSLIRNELGWQPRVSLREGLTLTLRHFERRRELLPRASAL